MSAIDTGSLLDRFARAGLERLRRVDPVLHDLLEREHRRQGETLSMVAASSFADPSVLMCEASPLANLTTEGHPGARFHRGCAHADRIECLAGARARQVFAARYANVQPHSGSSANQIVMFGLLDPGDTILGMRLDAGGHLTHGATASISGRYFTALGYGVTPAGRIDFDAVRDLARRHRPRLIVCGASAYPRRIEWARFREIADEIGAYVLADISHVAGLVAGGCHPNPIDTAHVTTTSTYKQLFGPRGGLILAGRDADFPVRAERGRASVPLAAAIDRFVFPHFQGTPNLHAIAAKARALGAIAEPAFAQLAHRIVASARTFAAALMQRDYRVATGGTDTHMVLVDLRERRLTGVVAAGALESCGIVSNMNVVADDPKGPRVTSGLRFGTNIVALRGLDDRALVECAAIVGDVLDAVTMTGDTAFHLSERVRADAAARVRALCRKHPIPEYPAPGIEVSAAAFTPASAPRPGFAPRSRRPSASEAGRKS